MAITIPKSRPRWPNCKRLGNKVRSARPLTTFLQIRHNPGFPVLHNESDYMRLSILFRLSGLLGAAAASTLFAQAPAIDNGGVVNAASFVAGQAVAPGSVVAIFGKQLAANLALADTVPWVTSLGNVSVSVNGMPAPLQFVAPGQINAQIPWNVAPSGAGMANLVVTSNGASSAPQAVLINPIAPGVFQVNNHAIAINITDPASARYLSFAAPTGSIPGAAAFPARVNDVLFVYANGLGPVDSPIADGAASTDTLRTNTTKPTAMVANTPATVLFSGLSSFPGINQVNMIVPQVSPGDALPLQFQSGGITSPNTTTIAVN